MKKTKFITQRKNWFVDSDSLHVDWPLEQMEVGDVIPLMGKNMNRLRSNVMSTAYIRYHKSGTRRFVSGSPKPGVIHIQRVE